VARITHPQKRVPPQFVAKACKLREEIRSANTVYEAVSDSLLTYFRLRENFTPMPRHTQIAGLAKTWEQLPSFGRLRFFRNHTKGSLQIAEARCVPVSAKLPTWDSDEPGISINLRTIVVQPPRFAEQSMTLAVIGVHAMARYLPAQL
jgi:hypothetical protein